MADPTDEDFEFELELAKAKAKAAKAAETPFTKALRELDASKVAYDALPPEKRQLVPEPDLRLVNVQTPQGVVQFTRDGEPVNQAEWNATKKRIGIPSDSEDNWNKVVSFLSGSPAWGFMGGLKGVATGQGFAAGQRDWMATAQRASQQSSPKLPESIPLIGGAPVLPMLGGMTATLPAGAARVAGSAFGVPLNTARASMATRVGLQGAIGGATAASSGPHSLTQGDVGGFLGDVAKGAGAGLLAGAVGEGVGSALAKAGEAVRPAAERFANSQAVKALLGGGTMVNRLKTQLGVDSSEGLQALGKDVRGLGVLGKGPLPRSASGINDATTDVLASSGDEIGRIRDLADELVRSGKASPADAVKVAQAYEEGVRGATQIASEAAVAPKVLRQSQLIIEQATPRLGGVPTTEGGTFKGLWNQTSDMQRSAFSPLASPAKLKAATNLQRGGVQSARSELARQMESAVGPDEMLNLREAMKRYSTAAKIKDVVSDTASRAEARNAIGLADSQLAQTVAPPGALAGALAYLSSIARGRLNAANALWAPTAAKVAAPTLGLSGAAARLGMPAAANQVRSSAWALKPEEAKGVEAYLSAP